MSRVIGYTRVSTGEQGRSGLGLAAQRDAILARYPGAEVIEEVASGGRADNRPALQAALAGMRRGDALVVSKVDRLARDTEDFCRIAKAAIRRGWALVCLDLGLDTSTPMGEAMATMAAAFARLERRRISERRREAAEAKRPELRVRRERILELATGGLSQRAIAAELGTHKETVARVLRAA